MTVACFWLEETGATQIGLRRYRPTSRERHQNCPRPGSWGYHGALVILGTAPVVWSTGRPGGYQWHHDRDHRYGRPDFGYPPHDDPRWPRHCDCGEPFDNQDAWQEWSDRLYRRTDTGDLTTLREAPPGAMWDAYWYWRKGPDGRCLAVRCPGGSEWIIDSRASNCTMPADDQHRCWVRHGDPPAITVDKQGLTCAAGAGSIQAGSYHGMLTGGVFSPLRTAGSS